MTNIPDGYGIIAGRSRKNAQAALDAAKAAGLESSVVTAVNEGYLVPDAVLDAYHKGAQPAEVELLDGSKPEVDEDGIPILEELTPTSDWKNADIADWAKAHGVDLGGATTKTDMLAAIAATNKEE